MNLTQLQQAVFSIYPQATLNVAYKAAIDAQGNAEITSWNNNLGAQPTADQLNAALTALQFQQAQTAQNALLFAAYQKARYATAVTITTASGVTLSFPTDTLTQQNITGYLVATDPADTTPMPLQDATGAVQMLTYADLKALAKAVKATSMEAWTKLQNLLGQLKTATTVAAVQAVTW